jgi:hypothetical protein
MVDVLFFVFDHDIAGLKLVARRQFFVTWSLLQARGKNRQKASCGKASQPHSGLYGDDDFGG